MKLVAQLQLKPTDEQHRALEQTMRAANAACDALSQLAWEHQEFGKYGLQKLGYHDVKTKTGLSAQVVIRCIAKVIGAYRSGKTACRSFKPWGSIAYDDRILSFQLHSSTVSIWTAQGRQTIPFVCGEHQQTMMQSRRGESDLCLVKGKWYLMVVCEVEAADIAEFQGVIGVDLGIVNIAVTSQGKVYFGQKITEFRRKTRAHQRRLQRCGTKSAKRHLKKATKRQARFVRDSNHCISKELVKDARAAQKALAIEDLKGIRNASKRLHKETRWLIGNWAFAKLRGFIEYKSALKGVTVLTVEARDTSRTCSHCGHCERDNRQTQRNFRCLVCGFHSHADLNAAINIAHRGTVNCPLVSNSRSSGTSLAASD